MTQITGGEGGSMNNPEERHRDGGRTKRINLMNDKNHNVYELGPRGYGNSAEECVHY